MIRCSLLKHRETVATRSTNKPTKIYYHHSHQNSSVEVQWGVSDKLRPNKGSLQRFLLCNEFLSFIFFENKKNRNALYLTHDKTRREMKFFRYTPCSKTQLNSLPCMISWRFLPMGDSKSSPRVARHHLTPPYLNKGLNPGQGWAVGAYWTFSFRLLTAHPLDNFYVSRAQLFRAK